MTILPGRPEDYTWLAGPETRPVRLQLEFLKVELALRRQGVSSTVVVFGGTKILEKHAAQERLRAAQASLAEKPDDPLRKRAVEVAERVLGHARYYDEARAFAGFAARAGQTIVTGGGPGIMEAANRGAHEEGVATAGFNIRLPEEQRPNAYVSEELSFHFRYFALRKMHFLLRARALVCFPGGFGSLDELTDALTLRQTGRMQPIPIILFGRAYWSRVVDFGFLADEGVIRDEHLELFHYAETAAEAWKLTGL